MITNKIIKIFKLLFSSQQMLIIHFYVRLLSIGSARACSDVQILIYHKIEDSGKHDNLPLIKKMITLITTANC